jgi:hypothetical protein
VFTAKLRHIAILCDAACFPGDYSGFFAAKPAAARPDGGKMNLYDYAVNIPVYNHDPGHGGTGAYPCKIDRYNLPDRLSFRHHCPEDFQSPFIFLVSINTRIKILPFQ